MSNAEFKANFAKLLKNAGKRTEDVVMHTALQLQSSMVQMSPVKTGRFKGNWQCGMDATNYNMDDAPFSDAVGRTAALLPSWIPGQTIYLTNSLPYARRLEYGWSKQAPQGMVRLTVQNYSRALAAAVRDLP